MEHQGQRGPAISHARSPQTPKTGLRLLFSLRIGEFKQSRQSIYNGNSRVSRWTGQARSRSTETSLSFSNDAYHRHASPVPSPSIPRPLRWNMSIGSGTVEFVPCSRST